VSDTSRQALAAAAKTLAQQPRRALEVFRVATEDDPLMADAWLGRVAAGDTALSTLKHLSDNAGRLGADLRALGMTPHSLNATFDVGYVRIPISDPAGARLSYAAALIDAGQWDTAEDLLSAMVPSAVVSYVRGVLASRVQRWPDVLTAVSGCETWNEQYLSRAASLLEALAAANLGLFDRADAAAMRAEESMSATDPIVCDARFCRALVERAQGRHDSAHTLLTDISLRWPDFTRAKEALADPTFGLDITDAATIDSRTDRWDPATATTAAQRAAAQHADTARQSLATAEETLAGMIGLEAVKQQIKALKASTITRELRRRKGIPTPARSRHMLMVGPPGVGKTESARAVGRIFCGLGLLPNPDVHEITKSDLTSKYVGATEENIVALLNTGIGSTVFFDEFGDLIQDGYSGGDALGERISAVLVPWLENHREESVFIAAGYPRACEKVLAANAGLQSRFPNVIVFESYPPDQLMAIAEAIIAQSGDCVESEAVAAVFAQPFARYYDEQHLTKDGDVVRTIDTLGNARFVRNVIEASQALRDERLVHELGLDAIDLSDDAVGEDISCETMSLLTREDLHGGLRQALPPGLRGLATS
jgi:type VII secretion ATPase EccA